MTTILTANLYYLSNVRSSTLLLARSLEESKALGTRARTYIFASQVDVGDATHQIQAIQEFVYYVATVSKSTTRLLSTLCTTAKTT